MPKKSGKFPRGYIRGAINNSLNLTTLAALTVVTDANDDAVKEMAWCSSIVCRWSLQNLTPGSGDGPILAGFCHSDYTDAEIEAFIEQDTSWDSGDMVSREIGKRKIRLVGVFDTPRDALSAIVLNDGKPIRSKVGWMLNTDKTIKWFAYNLGSSALATTVPALDIYGHANLWEVR